jgi:hypothetical protein
MTLPLISPLKGLLFISSDRFENKVASLRKRICKIFSSGNDKNPLGA